MADPVVVADPVVAPVEPVTPVVTPSWRDTLPDDLKADKSLADFKDVGALAKSFVETKKLVGGKSAVPDDKATPEAIAAFRKATGVPDAPEGYQVKRPSVALDIGWNDVSEKTFLASMHKLGAPPAVVQAAIDFYGQMEAAKLEGMKTEANTIGAQLRNEWGSDYDAQLGRANRAIQSYGGDALIERYAQNGLGRDPLTIKAWAKVGNDLVEAGVMRGDGVEGVSPEEAKSRINDANAELKKLPHGHPRTQELINEIVALTNASLRR